MPNRLISTHPCQLPGTDVTYGSRVELCLIEFQGELIIMSAIFKSMGHDFAVMLTRRSHL